MRYLVAALYTVSAALELIGLGLIYDLDKTTLDRMNAELGRSEVVEEKTVAGVQDDIDDMF
jgi:hypothetical protein